MLEIIESVMFFGIGPILWAIGFWLFLHSPLSRRKKISWTLVLIAAGAAIGLLLSSDMIRNKFVLVLLMLPVLAMLDVWLAKSERSFSFWFRACSFEVCTIFGTAAIFRYILDRLKFAPLI